MKLAIHIGLPKTGTTFLQKEIFPQLLKRNYLWKHLGESNSKSLTLESRKFLRSQGASLSEDINQYILNFSGVGLISNENISMLAGDMWQRDPIVPAEVVASNLLRLGNTLYSDRDAIGVIFTLRRQDSWLASRYAESAKAMHSPSQTDFEEKVRYILEEDNSRRLWLDYSYLYELFSSALPRHQVLFLLQEEMLHNPMETIRKLSDFFGIESTPPRSLFSEKSNVLSKSENIWRLKPFKKDKKEREETLSLNADLSKSIMDAYKISNQKIAKILNLDLCQYGYY